MSLVLLKKYFFPIVITSGLNILEHSLAWTTLCVWELLSLCLLFEPFIAIKTDLDGPIHDFSIVRLHSLIDTLLMQFIYHVENYSFKQHEKWSSAPANKLNPTHLLYTVRLWSSMYLSCLRPRYNEQGWVLLSLKPHGFFSYLKSTPHKLRNCTWHSCEYVFTQDLILPDVSLVYREGRAQDYSLTIYLLSPLYI